jgi:hypothetical protein
MAAFKVSGTKWDEARFVMFGSGTAGTGIADQIKDAITQNTGKSREEAGRQIWYDCNYSLYHHVLILIGALTSRASSCKAIKTSSHQLKSRMREMTRSGRAKSIAICYQSSRKSSHMCLWEHRRSLVLLPRKSSAKWQSTLSGRQFSHYRTQPSSTKRSRKICMTGLTARHLWLPARPSHPSSTMAKSTISVSHPSQVVKPMVLIMSSRVQQLRNLPRHRPGRSSLPHPPHDARPSRRRRQSSRLSCPSP